MTDEEALETYIHNEEYHEDEEPTLICCECYQTIGANEKYYEIDGNIYCDECIDDLFGHWN